MNIALLGYGKMGRMIEELAIQNGHQIVALTNRKNPIEKINFSNVDVAIEFSTPSLAIKHIKKAFQHNIPVVCGTTGWPKEMIDLENLTKENNTAFLYASNFSIGMNIFFELNKKLYQLMKEHSQYKVNIKEIHHTEKLDTPSGTALTLQSDLDPQTAIISERKANVVGTHIINYNSQIDRISITHESHHRKGFAQGAILAAEWIIDKKGCFSMKDLLKI